jgi:hypothetical protein
MAIRVYKDEKANAVIFEGSSFNSYWNGLLTASVNDQETGSIDVLNIAATSGSTLDFLSTGSNAYEYFRFPYTSFVNETGVAFGSATATADYINSVAQRPSLQTEITTNVQGYMSLLTDYYFNDVSGSGSLLEISTEQENTWLDVPIEVHPSGAADFRPQVMVDAQASGYETYSTQSVKFLLEGLDTSAFASFRAALSFNPDEDGGQVEARLVFNRTTGSTPVEDFVIADTVLNADQGASTNYPIQPSLPFFVGDTIDTDGAGNGGKLRFQIKSTVPGTLETRELTLFINR